MLMETLSIPALSLDIPGSEIETLAGKIDKIIDLKKRNSIFPTDISGIEKEIDDIVYKIFDLTDRDRYLVEDVLKYGVGLFQDREESGACQPPGSEEIENYAKILCEDINDIIQYNDMNVWITIYEIKINSPLNMTALHFSNRKEPNFVERVSSAETIDDLLRKIDKYTYEKFSESVYLRKNVKYYDDDTILLIKPNEKRFWSRSAAMNDAREIMVEVLMA
ncbi:MAG: hypothetical protein GY950_23500 [bacterium]|nr:hypothetical protein [bacterium]